MRRKVPVHKDIRFLVPTRWANLEKHSGENFAIQIVPSPGSFGDMILNRHFYRIRDHKSWIRKNDPETHFYLIARKLFFRRFRKENGGSLHCEYCGTGPLRSDSGNIFSKLPIATIDHKMPLSKGGARFDFDNMACSCQKCNNRKGVKLDFAQR